MLQFLHFFLWEKYIFLLLQVIDTLLLFYFIITLITKIKEIINILCSLWHFMIFLDLIFLKSKLLDSINESCVFLSFKTADLYNTIVMFLNLSR